MTIGAMVVPLPGCRVSANGVLRAVLALLVAVVPAAGPRALAFETGVPQPPFDATTVEIEVVWENDLVMLAYDLAPADAKPYASGYPGTSPACGEAGATLFLDDTDHPVLPTSALPPNRSCRQLGARSATGLQTDLQTNGATSDDTGQHQTS